MKIKYYPVTRAGTIAKTPDYYNSFDKPLCCDLVGMTDSLIYRQSSLYDMYTRICGEDVPFIHPGRLTIENKEVSSNEIVQLIYPHWKAYRETVILPKIQELKELIQKLKDDYKNSCQSLYFIAFESSYTITQYKNNIRMLEALQIGKIYTLDDSEDSIKIVDDIKPVTI